MVVGARTGDVELAWRTVQNAKSQGVTFIVVQGRRCGEIVTRH